MKPLARKDDLVIQEVGGEILIYDLRTNKAICLNQTSALVWQNCDGKKDALEIAREIEKELGSNISEDFIWFAINQLEKENLLNNRDKVESRFEGLSRREVIKKIGLGSMVALPIVAALVAPTSVMAQSCNPGGMGNPPGCPCTMSNQCIGMSMCVMDVCD